MLFLPKQANLVKPSMEKLMTYITLSNIGCPVFKSAVIMPEEKIDQKMIDCLCNYFKTDEVTVRYQYIRACSFPTQGGNKYKLSQKTLAPLQNVDTLLWILEPINRLKNDYGINLHFNGDCCTIEIVGKGFDVSDLNRGQLSPHQTILTELPVRWGMYNEWWKFLKFSFIDKTEYELSKNRRIRKLTDMGYQVSYDIFNCVYKPISISLLEELLNYVSIMFDALELDDYNVSCSVIDGHFIFWDIQTPNGKMLIYGVR